MFDSLKPALRLQLSHIALSACWNVAGIVLLAGGKQALGPTASWFTVGLLITFALLMVLGAKRYIYLYLIVSLVVIAGALAAIIPAFYKDPALWPSDFWRYAGVVLNSAGVIGALWGIVTYIRVRFQNNNIT